jgi:hypothetical protein
MDLFYWLLEDDVEGLSYPDPTITESVQSSKLYELHGQPLHPPGLVQCVHD